MEEAKDIKTKEKAKDIRALDKAGNLSAKMKKGLVRSKRSVQRLSDDSQVTPDEYAQDQVQHASEDITHDAAHGVKDTAKKTYDGGRKIIREIRQKHKTDDSIKQTAKSTGKQSAKTIKRDIKTAGNSAKKTVKTAEQTSRNTIKTTQHAVKTAERSAKAAKKSAEASAKAAKKAAQAAKQTAKATAKAAKAAAKVAAKAAKIAAKVIAKVIKAIAAAIEKIGAAIAAGGWVAVVVIVVICVVALIVASCFGLFWSGEDTGTGMTMQTAIAEINTEYQEKIEEIKDSHTYDVLEMSGARASWPDVLSVYAVKITGDPNEPQEAASMDENKLDILRSVFWDMHEITDSTETKTETVVTETDDGNGNIEETTEEVSREYLYITVTHKTAEEISAEYGFTDEQKKQMSEMTSEKNRKLWNGVLGGYSVGSDDIVNVAYSQLGNVGGQPYWSWYGFGSRVEWCACFVSWCANQCGYIETGVIPKDAGCINSVQWYKDRNEWADNSIEPSPGMIIYFDWNDQGMSGPQDGVADHVGIVEKVENGYVYTIEGNSGDMCAERRYAIGYYEILGYGAPRY